MATLLYSDTPFDDDPRKTQPLRSFAPASRIVERADDDSQPSMTDEVERRRGLITQPERAIPALATLRIQRQRALARNAPDEQRVLSSLVLGIALAAAIWAGLAILAFGLVIPMSFAGRVLMITIGTWITAAGGTYVFASRPRALV